MSLAPSKRGGSNAAAAIIQRHPELRHVPDTEAENWDAVTTPLLSPSDSLPFVGICPLGRGTVVEIKSCMVVYGENQRRGRFPLEVYRRVQSANIQRTAPPLQSIHAKRRLIGGSKKPVLSIYF